MPTTLTASQLERDLALRDLADPAAGPHAIQLLVALAVDALAEAWECQHPYTVHGRQVDVANGDEWVEVLECGLAHREVLSDAGLDGRTGLALGMGLDRLLMLRKGIPDIRLLCSTHPRIAGQMTDLEPYRPVSNLPAVTRDLSVAISDAVDTEQLGDRVRDALGQRADLLEAVIIVAEAGYADLPPAARQRLGMDDTQKNVLVRLVIRPAERTLTDAEANRLRDWVYDAIHEGAIGQWASHSSAWKHHGAPPGDRR